MRNSSFLLTVFASIMVVTPFCHSANDTKLKINDYIPDKYRDAVWQSSGNMSASGQSNNREDNQNIEFPLQSRDHISSANRYLHLYSRLELFSLSKKSWWRLSSGLSGSLSTGSSTNSNVYSRITQAGLYENMTDYDRNNSFSNLGLYCSFERGQYLIRSLAYNYSVSMNAGMYRSKSESKLHEESVKWSFPSRLDSVNVARLAYTTSRGRGLSANTAIGISVGYLYEGRYSAAVLHLLSEMNKRALLETEPSTSDFRTMCDTAYAYANKYFSDGRRRRVATSTALANTLINLGILKSPSGQLLIWMQDIWYGYSRESRQLGTKLTIGMSAEGNANYYQSEETIETDRKVRAHFLDYGDSVVVIDEHTVHSDARKVEYQSLQYYNTLTALIEKPISLRWQFRSRLDVQTGIRELIWDDNQPRRDINNWDTHLALGISSTIAFIADSRTTASGSGGLQLVNADEFVLQDYNSRFGSSVRDYRHRSLVLSGKLSYWASDNTQVAGNCAVTHSSQKYMQGRYTNDQNNTTISLSLYVTHFLM